MRVKKEKSKEKSHESYAHAEAKRGLNTSRLIASPFQSFRFPHNCTSLFTNLTSSPGLKAGRPIYGHPSHLKASPRAQLPQDPTLPWTVKSTSARSSACSLARFASALERLAASSALSRSARPQLQSLQARRRLVLGLHASAVKVLVSIAGNVQCLLVWVTGAYGCSTASSCPLP